MECASSALQDEIQCGFTYNDLSSFHSIRGSCRRCSHFKLRRNGSTVCGECGVYYLCFRIVLHNVYMTLLINVNCVAQEGYLTEAQQYAQETELSRRVRDWEERIVPVLSQEVN